MKKNLVYRSSIIFALMVMIIGAVAFPAVAADSGKIKNVIIVIGDGMGPQALGLLNSYVKYAPESIYKDKGRVSTMEKVLNDGTVGYAYHEAANVLVTDSAASATQIATGKRALSETIGIDQYGNKAETILEKAKKLGKTTGLVSDTRITHATPAAFAAHQTHRSKENAIAVELLENEVDVMFAGGLRYWIPKEASDKKSDIHKKLKEQTHGAIKIKSKRKDSRNLLNEAEAKGYKLAFTKQEMEAAQGDKLLGLFAYSAIPYRIDMNPDDAKRTTPQLKEMAVKAIDVLSKNEKGFFLMVESGLIDWTEHDNDAGAMLHELIRFDQTLEAIYAWAKGRDDTLLIVTADHETGGFSFSYSRKDLPEATDFPGETYKGNKFAPKFNFGSYDLLDALYNQKMSFVKTMGIFDGLADDQKTPAKIASMVSESTGFKISPEDGAAILEKEKNEYRVEGHSYLSSETFPKINDFKEFYVYSEGVRTDIIGRVLAKHQNVVWSTGTHTNTPVPLVAIGPENIAKKFGGIMHTTEWAQIAISSLTSGK